MCDRNPDAFSQDPLLNQNSNNSCRHAKVHTLAEARPVLGQLTCEMVALGFGYMDCFSVRFSLGEAIANAVKHAHRGDPTKTVHVSFLVTPDYVLAEVIDE